MRQQGGRRSAESGGSNVFSPQLARKSYLREESSMTVSYTHLVVFNVFSETDESLYRPLLGL